MVRAQRLLGNRRKAGEDDGNDDGHGAIALRGVHQDAVGGFPDDGKRQHGDHPAEKQQEPVELAAQGAAGAVTRAGDQDQGADLNGQNASIEHHVGRAEDFDVEAVGVVPPVIERRGGEHGGATPGGNEGAERPAEFPYADAGRRQARDCGRKCRKESGSRR